MQFLSPMQLFVWIVGVVAASMLVIGLMSEWIFRIWFNCKKQWLADIAQAAGTAMEKVSDEMSKKKVAQSEEARSKAESLFKELLGEETFEKVKANLDKKDK